MRHRVKTKQLGRNTKARKHLLIGQVRSLLLYGSITTTRAKAKEIARLTDTYISKAKSDSVATRRQLHTFFGKRDVVNALVDSIAPLFPDKVSGFTTISDVGTRRGDNAQLARVALTTQPENIGTFAAPKDVEATDTVSKKKIDAVLKKSSAKSAEKASSVKKSSKAKVTSTIKK